MSQFNYYDTIGLDPNDMEIFALYDFLWEEHLAANEVFDFLQDDQTLTIRTFTIPGQHIPTYTADFVHNSYEATYTCRARPNESFYDFRLQSMNDSMKNGRPRITVSFECVYWPNDIGQPFLNWKMFEDGTKVAWGWASRRRRIVGIFDDPPRRLSDDEKETLGITAERDEEQSKERSDDEQDEEEDGEQDEAESDA